jgi:hypothetical protein
VRELPLLVSGPLIGPILRDEKTVTRRLPRNPGGWLLHPRGPTMLSCYQPSAPHDYAEQDIDAPYVVGDVLWVRETWHVRGLCHTLPIAASKAAAPDAFVYAATPPAGWTGGWRPSIHMPRWAARIFLRVESVTVERVQEITEEDAQREGVVEGYDGVFDDADYCARVKAMGATIGDARPVFAMVWDSLAPAGSKWADNPWVWVVGFRRVAGLERA